MKTLLVILVSCSIVTAQQIEGPEKVVVNTPQLYKVVEDDSSPLAAGTELLYRPNQNVNADPEFFVPGALQFWANETGIYTIEIIATNWEDHRQKWLVKEIVVTDQDDDGDEDDDDDDEDPPLPPTPGQKYQVMFFTNVDLEDNLPADQRNMLNSVVLRDKIDAEGHLFRGCFDVSASARASWPTKKVQRCNGLRCWYEPVQTPPADTFEEMWWQAVSGDPLPRVAIAPLEGGTVLDYPLPATEAELMELLQKGKP